MPNLLQSARLLVVSRLLLKSLSDGDVGAKSLDSSRKRLLSLRRRLLPRINFVLENPKSRLPELLESICSYCLVTSSSAEDGLAHLRQLRLEKIRRRLTASLHSNSLCEILRYQLSSLQTFRSLFGRPIVEAIYDLQRKPILADPSIRELESLDLDRIISLIPNDIRSFVPYFKRSAPTAEEMQSTLEAWSREACQIFSKALRHYLQDMDQLEDVLDLRKQLFNLLLPSYFSTSGGSTIKEEITQAVNGQVTAVFQRQENKLQRSTDLLLDTAKFGQPPLPLWSESLAFSSLESGSNNLIRKVRKRHAGHNSNLSKVSRALDQWVSLANNTLSQLDDLSKTRWRDILEEPDEDGEDDAAALIRSLTEGDPKLYRQAIQTSLKGAVLKHETSIADAANNIVDGGGDLSKAVALLRSIHVSTSSLQNALPGGVEFAKLQKLVPRLQQMVADKVAERLVTATAGKTGAGKWDKSVLPENAPSPRAFSTLRRLCKIMLEVGGTDSWSPALVQLVKKAVGLRIFETKLENSYMHHDFDKVYLAIALELKPTGNSGDAWTSAELSTSASEYWTRTKLLFGILA